MPAKVTGRAVIGLERARIEVEVDAGVPPSPIVAHPDYPGGHLLVANPQR